MAIELVNLSKQYEDFYAVDDLTMTIPESSLTVLIGPSGCGKTTTMKMINRLIERTNGDIRFDGESIDNMNTIQLRRSIGYVIQEIGLFPHMTVYENIAVVPRLLKWKEGEIRKRIRELLDLVNMDPKLNMEKFPAQLSGGQRQRIGVARGLAADPDILLMDEPFGAIDPINREKLQDSFLEIQKSIQKTIVFVTHDIREAVKLGDHIAILDKGKIAQYDSAMEVINNPANVFVEDLLGSDRALKGMELLKVKDHLSEDIQTIVIEDYNSVGKALKYLQKEDRDFIFVVNNKNKLEGYITQRELTKADQKESLFPHVKPVDSLRPYSTLMEAVSHMFKAGLIEIPVVNDHNKMLGSMRLSEVFAKVRSIAGTNV
ncbi:MAG: betaine/proline/choline family ABC transporter ATP-binding protein [Spirochaetia bacterium]